jgi:hypothetical protein
MSDARVTRWRDRRDEVQWGSWTFDLLKCVCLRFMNLSREGPVHIGPSIHQPELG